MLRLGAENGARTRDLNLGKVALYQLSYFRVSPYVAFGIAKVRSFFEIPNFFTTFFALFCLSARTEYPYSFFSTV